MSTMGLEKKIDYEFKDSKLLELCRTHASIVNERKQKATLGNGRAEFLGDAVLELVISSYIYEKYPELLEGELTKLRASVVCESSLAKVANELELFDDLIVGKGEAVTGSKRRDSVLSDFFEAIIGAIYLDGGFEAAKTFILRELRDTVEYMHPRFLSADSKTILQEEIQKRGSSGVEYRVTSETGPEHDKTFLVNVVFERQILGTGEGKTKKEAEQNAAAKALKKIGRIK